MTLKAEWRPNPIFGGGLDWSHVDQDDYLVCDTFRPLRVAVFPTWIIENVPNGLPPRQTGEWSALVEGWLPIAGSGYSHHIVFLEHRAIKSKTNAKRLAASVARGALKSLEMLHRSMKIDGVQKALKQFNVKDHEVVHRPWIGAVASARRATDDTPAFDGVQL